MGLDRTHHGCSGPGPAVLLCQNRIIEGAHQGQHDHKAPEMSPQSARWRFTILEAAQYSAASQSTLPLIIVLQGLDADSAASTVRRMFHLRARLLVIHNPNAGPTARHLFHNTLVRMRRAGARAEIVETSHHGESMKAITEPTYRAGIAESQALSRHRAFDSGRRSGGPVLVGQCGSASKRN
jgi:hypothetical protein